MICEYVRQTTQYSPFVYVEDPRAFHDMPESSSCYKNIVFLTQPTEIEEKKLRILCVGYEVSDPTKMLLNRIYDHYMILHYIVGGKGSFNGIPIKRGDCAVAFRNELHSFCTDPDDVLRFYWIMIRMPDDLPPETFGLKAGLCVFHYDFEPEMTEIVGEMLYFNSKRRDPHTFFLGKLYELISLHKGGPERESWPPSTSRIYCNYVSLAKRMWEQTDYNLSVEDVARSLGFSRKHFSSVFFGQTGVLPQQYIIEHKIRQAKLRMEAGESNLKEISFQLGYADYPSFSRAFKKQVGVSPRDYLNRIRRKSTEEIES